MRDFETINKSNPNLFFVGWSGLPTENHQLQAADKLIAKLKQQLGEERAYNDELQDMVNNNQASKQLEKENDALNAEIDSLNEKLNRQIILTDTILKESKSKDGTISALNRKIEALNEKVQWYNNKYSQDKNEVLSKDELYQKVIKKIDLVISNYKQIQKRNEELLQEIVRLQNERNY